MVFLSAVPALAASPHPQYAATVDYTTRTITLHRTGEVFKVAVPASSGMRKRGVARVTEIRKDPVWTPTPNIRRVMASRGVELRPYYRPYRLDRANPLGTWMFRITFGGADSLRGIHGTNDPASIGKAVTLGCFRVYNEVIEYIARNRLLRPGDLILFK